MEIDVILAAIDSDIARLKLARAALSEDGAHAARAEFRPSLQNSSNTRTLSFEARMRIAEAQRKRWAAVRAKSAPISTPVVKVIGSVEEPQTPSVL